MNFTYQITSRPLSLLSFETKVQVQLMWMEQSLDHSRDTTYDRILLKKTSIFHIDIHWCIWLKLIESRSMPSGHIMFFLIGLIESGWCCCCWRQVLANDSIANVPLRRLNRTIPTTKRTVSTTEIIVAMIMMKRSRRSANRNYNRSERMNSKGFHSNVFTNCRTGTGSFSSVSSLGRFFCLLNHCRQLNKLWDERENWLKTIVNIWTYLLLNDCLSLSRSVWLMSVLEEVVASNGSLSFAILFLAKYFIARKRNAR